MALDVNITKKTFNSLKTKSDKGEVISQIKLYKGFNLDNDLKHLSYIKLIGSGSWLACHLYNPNETDKYVSINRAKIIKSIKMFVDSLIDGVDNSSFKQIKSTDNSDYKKLVKISEFIKSLR